MDVYIQDETVWLTQKALARLFGVQRPAVKKHLGNIFASGELQENSVCSILEHTAGGCQSFATSFQNPFAGGKMRADSVVKEFLTTAADWRRPEGSHAEARRTRRKIG